MARKQNKEQHNLNPQNSTPKAISRRAFFKAGVAAGVGATALGGPGKSEAQESSSDIEWHYEVDVVVVGSGATGQPAAIKARDPGVERIHVSIDRG